MNYRVTSVTGPEGVANSTSSFYRGSDFAQREYAVCFRAPWYLELELPWFSSTARKYRFPSAHVQAGEGVAPSVDLAQPRLLLLGRAQ